FNEISVSISFRGNGRDNTLQNYSVTEEELYSAAILNFEQSKKWLARHHVPESFKKNSSSGPGDWYKLSLLEDGIYKITTEELESFGVNITGIDIDRIKLYSPYFEGRVMDGTRGAEVTPNLKEIPLWRKDTNSNGKFESGEEIVFYGKGSSGWEYNKSKEHIYYSQNPYSIFSAYWLNVAPAGSSPGVEMDSVSSASNTPDIVITRYDAYLHHEEDLINFLRTGTGFFGVSLSGRSDISQLPLTLNNVITAEEVNFRMRLRSGIEDKDFGGRLMLKLGSKSILLSSLVKTYGTTVVKKTMTADFLTSGVNNFSLVWEGIDAPSKVYFDWLEIRYKRELKAESDRLHFFSPFKSGALSFNASGFSSTEVAIYNVTDLASTYRIIPSQNTTASIVWQEQADDTVPSEYYLAAAANYLSVNEIVKVEGFDTPKARITNTQAEYIIISHEDFRESADRLAKYRTSEAASKDRLNSAVYDINDIVLEFSAGQTDPMAIRYFFKHAYENWNEPKPSFALLFGDGDYDYRNITGESTNFIMTYQLIDDTTTENHISYIDSRAADDHFAFISGNDVIADLSLGRIVARTAEDAESFVEKLILYESQPIFGNWKNTLTIVADDLFRPSDNPEAVHIIQSENIIKSFPQTSDIRKIYLTEYKIDTDAAVFGVRKPDATEALLGQLNRGTTFLVYIGHGGPTVLAQERLLSSDRDLNIIDTGMKLPVWVAGTCEFGRYDDPNIQSMAEDLLVQNQNGAIGMFAASRLVYSGDNSGITKAFFKKLLPDFPYSSNTPRIGTALLSGKILHNRASNDQKYHYLGDPTMRVALPKGRAAVNEPNPRTLQALGKAILTGNILDENGNKYSSGDITVAVNIFDSVDSVSRSETLNGVTGSVKYVLPGSRIFSGPVSAVGDRFESTFIVPRDIKYGGNTGRGIVYWWDEKTGMDGAGSLNGIEYDGTANVSSDNVGPDIIIGFEELYFRSGDLIPSDATLKVIINDENGINLAEEVGHKITLTIDNELNSKINVTQFFEYDINSYQKGTLIYPMPLLDAGEHSVTVKAWDSYNNFSEETTVFNISSSEDLAIERVYNYPNPMSESTDFTFYLTQPAEVVEICIYTVAGRLIRKIQDNSAVAVG
ncbi:MAG: type IX secretion system sortase PorU, partial [Candidatus Marinimicrobia bacterium]|nr:type IX secretion system sortase PorU [Candidatus Neomarinimicrobiota bacterium]